MLERPAIRRTPNIYLHRVWWQKLDSHDASRAIEAEEQLVVRKRVGLRAALLPVGCIGFHIFFDGEFGVGGLSFLGLLALL